MSEDDKNKMVGELVRKQEEAETGFAALDTKIKQIGDRIEKLGAMLKNAPVGGDSRDLLHFLENDGVSTTVLDGFLKERNRLASVIAECKEKRAQLKGL